MIPGSSRCGGRRCCAGPTSSSTTGCRWRRCSTWRRRAPSASASARRRARSRCAQEDINALLVERGRAGEHGGAPEGRRPVRVRPRRRGGGRARRGRRARSRWCPASRRPSPRRPTPGIPVTLRHSSTSFTVVTGHEDPSVGDDGSVDWRAVAQVGGTIVILMGVARIGRIAEELMAGGPLARHAGGRRAVGHPTRAAHRPGHARHDRRPAAGHAVGDRGRRGRRRGPVVVRAPAAVRARGSWSPARGSRRRSWRRRCATPGAEPIEVPVIEVAEPADGGAALAAAAASARHLRLGRPHLAQRRPPAARRGRDRGRRRALRSAAPGSPPSARAPRPCWPAAACGPTSCPSGSWPRRSSRRCPTPGRRARPAGPRRGGARRAARRPARPRAGRSTSSTPTARCRRRSTDEQRVPRSAAPTSSPSPRRPPSTASSRRSASTRCRRSWPASARSPRPPRATHGLTVDVEADGAHDRRARRRAGRVGRAPA